MSLSLPGKSEFGLLECTDPVLVSVIVPVFNRTVRIRECIASVQTQTYRPIELVVVDDGSTDETPASLDDLKEQFQDDDGIQFIALRQENAGAPAARNNGLRKSSGKWVLFLDSDDLLLPHKIENAIASSRQTGANIVYSKAQFVDEVGNRLQCYWGRRLSGDWHDYFEFSWQTMCALYSRLALNKIGIWNENLTMSQDWEFCIRAVSAGLAIHFDDSVDSLYLSVGNDRIGSGITAIKNQGRENALWSVYEHLEHRNLMCPNLKRRFCSRLLHVFLSFCSLNEMSLAWDLISRMVDKRLISRPVALCLRLVTNPWLANLILKRFRPWMKGSE